MSYELIYTSAPQGLKPGSRGFCTVAQSEGLPAAAAMICESLSGYTHLYDLQDARYPQNPVAWSHLVGRVQGGAVSILSRVSSLRADYTGRTNKIAHHRILSPGERQPCGPAEILRRPGTFRDDWNEQPALLKPVVLPGIREPASCRAELWQQLAGDAGLAGEFAQSFLDNPARPCFVIYEPGTDVLGLFAEALNLLPPSARWQVGFTTYFSGLPAGMECTWRGCPVGSEAAEAAMRTLNGLVVDLRSGSVGGARAVNSALIEAAGTGVRGRGFEAELGIVPATTAAQTSGIEPVKTRAESSPPNRQTNQRVVHNQRGRSPTYVPPASGGVKSAYKAASIAAILIIIAAAIAAYILLDDRPEIATTNKVDAVHEIETIATGKDPVGKIEEPVAVPVSTNHAPVVVAPPPPEPPQVMKPVQRAALFVIGSSAEMPQNCVVKFIDVNGVEIEHVTEKGGISGQQYYYAKNDASRIKTSLAEISKKKLVVPDNCNTNLLYALIEYKDQYKVVASKIHAFVVKDGQSVTIKPDLAPYNEFMRDFTVKPIFLSSESYTALVRYSNKSISIIQTNSVDVADGKFIVNNTTSNSPAVDLSSLSDWQTKVADWVKFENEIRKVLSAEEEYNSIDQQKVHEKEKANKKREEIASYFAGNFHGKILLSMPKNERDKYGNAVPAGAGRPIKEKGPELYKLLRVDQYISSLKWNKDGLLDLALAQKSSCEKSQKEENDKVIRQQNMTLAPASIKIIEGGHEIISVELPKSVQTFNQNASP